MRTHLSTWWIIFKYFNCVMHNYIKHIHNYNHLLSYFKLHDTLYNVCNDKGKYSVGQGNYCGQLDLALKLKCTPWQCCLLLGPDCFYIMQGLE